MVGLVIQILGQISLYASLMTTSLTIPCYGASFVILVVVFISNHHDYVIYLVFTIEIHSKFNLYLNNI